MARRKKVKVNYILQTNYKIYKFECEVARNKFIEEFNIKEYILDEVKVG